MGVCVCKGWVGVHLFDSPSAGQGLVDGSREFVLIWGCGWG